MKKKKENKTEEINTIRKKKVVLMREVWYWLILKHDTCFKSCSLIMQRIFL